MADLIWHRIDRELARRKEARETPGSWSALGRAIDVTPQVLTNWKTRGVPPKEHAEIAKALGWTVDQLLGIAGEERAPGQKRAHQVPAPAQPPADFSDRRWVSESDWTTLLDVRLVLPEQELKRIHEEAERLRKVSAQQLEAISHPARTVLLSQHKHPERTSVKPGRVGGISQFGGLGNEAPSPAPKGKKGASK